jgi:hypothetical protein
MRWPWRHREFVSRADEALAETRKEREETERRGEEIRSLTKHLRQLRAENHFADNIRRALGDNQ